MGLGICLEQDISNIERVSRKRPKRSRQKVNQGSLFEIKRKL